MRTLHAGGQLRAVADLGASLSVSLTLTISRPGNGFNRAGG